MGARPRRRGTRPSPARAIASRTAAAPPALAAGGRAPPSGASCCRSPTAARRAPHGDATRFPLAALPVTQQTRPLRERQDDLHAALPRPVPQRPEGGRGLTLHLEGRLAVA